MQLSLIKTIRPLESLINIRVCVFILFVLIHGGVAAQLSSRPKIDSLKRAERQINIDTQKIAILLQISDEYVRNDNDSAHHYLKKSLSQSIVSQWQYGIGKSYGALGRLMFIEGQLDSSRLYYEKANNIFYVLHSSTDNLETIVRQALLYEQGFKDNKQRNLLLSQAYKLNESIRFPSQTLFVNSEIANHLFRAKDYVNAARYELLVLKAAESGNNFDYISRASLILSQIYSRMDDVNRAVYYAEKQVGAEEKLPNSNRLQLSYANLAQIYTDLKDFDKVVSIHEKAISIARKDKDTSGLAVILGNAADGYYFKGDTLKAIEYSKEALLFSKYEPDNQSMEGIINSNIGKYYYAIAKYSSYTPEHVNRGSYTDSAEKYLTRGYDIARSINNYELLQYCTDYLSSLYILKGDAAKALGAFMQFQSYKDSTLNINQKDSIRQLQLNYDLAKKQDSIKLEEAQKRLLLEKAIQLNALKVDYERKQTLARTEKEKQQLRYEESLKRQQIESNYAIRQAELVAGQRQKDLMAASTKKQLQLSRLVVRQQWYYSIAALILLLGAGFWYYLYNRNRSLHLQSQILKERAEQELKESEYKNKMNEITFSALRSQMNPHFVFNCLNSIKLYTEQNNSEAASAYLSKFASLIRNTLENARTEKVILIDEINNLDLYLQMETMRFKEKLKYHITVDKDVDTEFIEIPPMLLQPYVENAIWHGLMQRKEGGEIKIHFRQAQKNDFLVVTIHDNGIGRARAALLKTKSVEKHKSYGTQITGERISLINEKYGVDAEVDIQDLKNGSNDPAGTLVTLKLPI